MNRRVVSQQSQKPGVATIVIELAKVEFAYRRVDEAYTKGAGRRVEIAFLH